MANKHPSGMPVWYSPSKGTYSPYRVNDDDENFDSLFEFEVFRALENTLRGTHYRIVRQAPVLLRQETRHYPPRNWKCDFSLVNLGSDHVGDKILDGRLIEVKGIVTREFRLEMEMLSRDNPCAFNHLWLVVTRKKPKLPIQQFTVQELKSVISKELRA